MIVVNFTNGKSTARAKGEAWQYDYGQKLYIHGLDLPEVVEIGFSLEKTGGEDDPRFGITKDKVTEVTIPDTMMEGEDTTDDYMIYAFIFVEDESQESGQTVNRAEISVKSRPKRWMDEETGDTFSEIVGAVKELVEAYKKDMVSDEQIAEAVAAYLTENPPEGLTEEEVRAIVNAAIGDISQTSFEKVDALPETGKENVICLVPSEAAEEDNVYDEYLYINGVPELIGSTKIDLEGYAKKATTLAGYGITDGATKEEVSKLQDTVNDKIGDLSKLSAYGTNVVDIILKLISGGNITPEEKDVLETYNIFVPQNVSDEWDTGGSGNTVQAKTLNISTTEFLELFYDGFVSNPPSGMTVAKTSIGKDQSGQYDMWEYDFKPTNYSRTILLSSGMHTYELPASFGLANFIGHLYTDVDNDAFEYIRKNVRVKVIPIVNPWGFNQSPKTYGNMNGVNPNRNFDLDGQWSAFPDYSPADNEWNVKGDYPFSEAESSNLAKWASENWNAEFWIDCHTGAGYSDSDLWLYYSSDSVILNMINNGISRIETWFKETYGKDCVTKRTIDNEGSIRLHWAEKIVGLAGITLEQASCRTTFGTANNNDSGDISNYSTNISTFVQEFLLEKYRTTQVIPIETVANPTDITLSKNDVSLTIEAHILPVNATQNKFEWVSSDESVCKVYGGTNKAIVVKIGTGTATLTATNRYNNSIIAQCLVTVKEDTGNNGGDDTGEDVSSEIGVVIGGIDTTNGALTENDARLITTFIPVESDSTVSVTSEDGYYVKSWLYDADYNATGEMIGSLSSTTMSGVVSSQAHYIRVLMKKVNETKFTNEDITNAIITVNGVKYGLVELTKYSVVYNLENVQATIAPAFAVDSEKFKATLAPSTGYLLLDDNIVVKMGDTVLENVVSNGVVAVENVTGNITITANGGNLEVEYALGTVSYEDGSVTEATNRVYTVDLLPIKVYKEGGYIKAVNHTGLSMVFRYYDSNYNFIGMNSDGWIADSGNEFPVLDVPSEQKHIRIVFKKADDSDLSNMEVKERYFTIDGVRYNLVPSEQIG